MTTPIPDDTTQRTRTLLISGIVVLALVVLGLTGWAVFRPKPKPSTPGTFTPAEETSASTSATASAETSETTSAVTSVSASTSGGASSSSSAPPVTVVRAGKIAFLLGNGVFVANEDGAGAKQVVAQVDSGATFSLSPDGGTLALVSGTDPKSLELIDIATGQAVQVPNAIDLPDWAPDSTWVAYTAHNGGSFAVRRVNRDGSGDTMLSAPGADPEISPDGTKVAYSLDDPPNAADSLQVIDLVSNKILAVPKSAGAVNCAWGPDGSLYFVQPGKSGGGVASVAAPPLSGTRVLGSIATTSQVGGPGNLYPSPNGKSLLLTYVGDDGYSRMFVLDVKDGSVRALVPRDDAYPLGWSVDGSHILYIQGNVSSPNQTTSLYRINPDGSQRLMVVGGAGS